MKKLLILILIALLVTLTIFIALNGIKIGGFEILGIEGLQQRNEDVDQKIQEATKLASTDYKKIVSTLEENAQKLEKEKQNYDDITAVSSEGDVKTANQIEKYEIETLWVRLGNHATSEGAIMKMDVTKGANNASDHYDLKFTVTGSYISITDFISSIENDSMLGFKIEEFRMEPSGNDLQATFTCKDIAIVDVSSIAVQTDKDKTDENNKNNAENQNTTNSENTQNNTNSTKENNTNDVNNANTSNNTNTAS